jgi:hypothetical protein
MSGIDVNALRSILNISTIKTDNPPVYQVFDSLINYLAANDGSQLTGIDSSNLADVKMGEWQPRVLINGTQAGITYTEIPYASYTRVFDMCFCSMYIRLANKGASVGNVTITGLPYQVRGVKRYSAFNFGYYDNMAVADVAPSGLLLFGQQTMNLYRAGGGTIVAITDADLTNTTGLVASFFYHVDRNIVL